MTEMSWPYNGHEYPDDTHEYRDDGHEYPGDPYWPGRPPSWTEEMIGSLSYLGAILTGPVLPLLVCLAVRHSSEFVRSHAVQALNVTLTTLLYAVSGTIVGVLLSFDSGAAALEVMLPITGIAWAIVITHLGRGAAAAHRGEYRALPAWVCAPLVT